MNNSSENFFDTKVLGHPAGLFVLFFTEMWERFSFYGMRVLLVNFLTMAVVGVDFPGWGWSSANAGALFGTYAGLLYITPIAGGLLADKLIGYRWAVVIGAFIMTLGHASMAFETELSLYIGLALLVIGTGFFKPNMTSIISEMYKGHENKKDGAYTIFYMGVNAGAFFGMMLCGWLAERYGWSYGFGLAGVFMLLGTAQFWLAKPLFGEVGGVPKKDDIDNNSNSELKEIEQSAKRNPFTSIDKVLIIVSTVIAFAYIFNDPISKIGGVNFLTWASIPDVLSGEYVVILSGLVVFLYLIITRLIRYEAVVRDRLIAFIVFAFFTVFFWMCFEQGATSLVLFARDFTQRTLEGNAANTFLVVNALLTIIPLAFITYVLVVLFKKTRDRILSSNIILFVCFSLMWVIVGFMLYKDWTAETTEITVSWFSILNSFFIIVFASMFTKIWDNNPNFPASYKYGLSLIIMAIGFGLLAYGSLPIEKGAAAGSVRVSMIWLILAYLFHTLGELCGSPVGLSYVSKLVPARMIAFMFGMWYLAIAIGNKLAATLGGKIEEFTQNYSLSQFFLIFTIIPIVSGILIFALHPLLKKLMHGVR
ncbi:peptide MFS transporter [Winogradskyella poriferorum]|uniref:peptide MFS transporter n=1 Tax=Winogradskyella poriferorum TaxID=307627 RepID=UPI003D650D28